MKNKPTHRKILLIGLPLLAVVLVATAVIGLINGTSNDADDLNLNLPKYGSTNALERPALERSARNTAAQTDANYLIAAAAESVSNNAGQLPDVIQDTPDGVLKLCRTTCDANSVEVSPLRYYANTTDAVKLVPYRDGLIVDGMQTLILVSGATCQGEMVTIGSGRSMAVIFGKEVGRNIEGQCRSF